MDEFLDILLDSFLDTIKLLPVLLIVYFLIEFLEYSNVLKFERSALLKGNASPVMGALFGTFPQCGFSVISSELYSERKISIGALIAVFIATSDEALPMMLLDYKTIPALLVLLSVKIIVAIIVGYLAMFLYKRIFKNADLTPAVHEHEKHIHACCHHDVEAKKFNWKHPLVHSLKIALYIFIFNIVLGLIVYFVGKDNISNFLESSNVFQPVFAVLVGLIPNCVSSVILTELYISGSITFGAIITGLCVNAGIGLIVLFKENKNKKENLFIVLSLIISSLIIGYALHFLPINLF